MAADWFDEGGTASPVDATKLLDSQVGAAVAAIVDAGALVSMGLTSDGGALGITVTVDGRWRREYFREEDHALAWLAEALPAVTAARGRQVASSGRGNGQRRPKTR